VADRARRGYAPRIAVGSRVRLEPGLGLLEPGGGVGIGRRVAGGAFGGRGTAIEENRSGGPVARLAERKVLLGRKPVEGRVGYSPGAPQRVGSVKRAVTQRAVEATRRGAGSCRGRRRPDRRVVPVEVALGAHGRVRQVGVGMLVDVERAPAVGMGGGVAVEAGGICPAAGEIARMADLAGDEPGTSGGLLGRGAVRLCSGWRGDPSRDRPVVACGGEAGGIRDPPFQIIPMTEAALRDR